MVCVSKGKAQAQEKSQTTTVEQWWIPSDPLIERRLVLVLTKMARHVLAHTEKLPPVRHTPAEQVGEPLDDVLERLHPADGDGAP